MTKQLVDTLKAWARWPGASPEIVSASSAWISVWLRHLGGKYVSDMLAAYGGIIPFGGTFLNFISYALGAVRISALSSFRVLYVMTHDSIGLGM